MTFFYRWFEMQPELAHVALAKPAIWVADDDQNFLELFKVACSSIGLIDVFSADSGNGILELLDQASTRIVTSIIFLDIRMEEHDSGFSVLEKIRKSDRYSICPVIMMSSSLLQDDVRQAAKMGASCYFYKPVGSKRRVEAVRVHVDYWANAVLLPETSPVRSELIGDLRSRGTAWYAIDRLRQDLLVALLRDLDRLSAIDLPELTIHQIRKTLVRLNEAFDFRLDVFDEQSSFLVREFSDTIADWIDAARREPKRSLLQDRKQIMDRARSIRLKLSVELRKIARPESDDSSLRHLDYLFWDVFVELSHNPEFPYLYSSLLRFQRKAFS